MSLSQRTYKGCTLTSLQLNLEGSQLFCPYEGKGPHEGSDYFHQHYFSLEVVTVQMMFHPCHALYGVIVGAK